ncbi:MAG: ribonuclease HI [Bdellovibrionaceae bacterium]|nr:ribonuclease HI [Bdellovibrio sp.]
MKVNILHSFIKRLKFLGRYENSFQIYTDGSHKGRWGSWAFVIVRDGKTIHESSGRARHTSSHRMEFYAALVALAYFYQKFDRGTAVEICSDSKVLINTMTKPQIRLGLNADQIEDLKVLTFNKNIQWTWIKAHAGHVFNERCDQLCIEARA